MIRNEGLHLAYSLHLIAEKREVVSCVVLAKETFLNAVLLVGAENRVMYLICTLVNAKWDVIQLSLRLA